MNRLFRPTEKKHNEISKKNSRIRGQSPRHTVGQCLKLEKTHSGIFCVDLRDNNRSVGFAHENPPLSRSAGEGWGEGGSCPLCRISASHPHPNLPPIDGGRDKVAVAEKRSSEKPISSFSDDLSVLPHQLKSASAVSTHSSDTHNKPVRR